MRQFLAAVGCGALVGACSLIYNPNNITKTDAAIPPTDAPPDMKLGPQDAPEMITDANAAAITLTGVEPDSIVEGQGSAGSRKAVLVVHGMNIVTGATISIAATNGSDTPMVTSTVGAEVVGTDHNFIAVPVTAAVNGSCDTGMIPLTVTVTQAGGSASVGWQLKCLPQVNQAGPLSLPTAAANEYSEFVLTGPGGLGSASALTASDLAHPLIVRATADLSIAGTIDVGASGQSGGPGGSAGGAASTMGGGSGGGGPGGGLFGGGGGGGAGYHDKGTDGSGPVAGGPAQGDPALTGGYPANYASGGGGGDGVGGGGGGTIELTAGGGLTTHTINSKGAAGANSTLGSGGGGGAGGTVVLRGASMAIGSIDVSGGAGTKGGGGGSTGRVRIDTPVALNGTPPAAAYAGFSIDPTTPYITNTSLPTITLHGTAGARYDIFTIDQSGNIKDEADNKLLGAATGQVMPQVHWGWNKVCVTPHSPMATPTLLETASCVEIAFLP